MDMDGVDQRVAELFMFDFEQSGIHLEQKKVKHRTNLKKKKCVCAVAGIDSCLS